MVEALAGLIGDVLVESGGPEGGAYGEGRSTGVGGGYPHAGCSGGGP